MIEQFDSIHIDNGSVKIDISFDELSQRVHDAQKWLDQQVFQDTIPYIPMDTGNMTERARQANVGNEGTGKVVMGNTVYAWYQWRGISRFSGNPLHYQTIHHPYAQKEWFHAAKKDFEQKWIEGVRNRIYGR